MSAQGNIRDGICHAFLQWRTPGMGPYNVHPGMRKMPQFLGMYDPIPPTPESFIPYMKSYT
jgi:hypothetical protein